MAQDQKQKVLLAILAVLALGAGSYYFFFRDSGDVNRAAFSSGPAERRTRKESEQPKATRRTETRREPTETPVAERRERAEPEEKAAATRRAGKTKGTDVKKKELKPAA